MAIVTTYICDVSGKEGKKEDFVEVRVVSQRNGGGYSGLKTITKAVHIDAALKLGLVDARGTEVAAPEITFEGKLKALLEDHVEELVQGHLDNFERR